MSVCRSISMPGYMRLRVDLERVSRLIVPVEHRGLRSAWRRKPVRSLRSPTPALIPVGTSPVSCCAAQTSA